MNKIFQLNFIAGLIIILMMHFTCLSAMEDQRLENDLLTLLPGQEDPGDWHMTSEPQFFNPDNLFEYINGAADLYLTYGFRKVITANYNVGKDSSSVNVEIYYMKSPTHAFGIYAAERSREEMPVAVGVQGYKGPNVLNFYKGPYYVKMMAFIISEDLMASIEQTGKIIADKIPGEFKAPEIFHYFPVENMVKRSERYIPTNFLGQSYIHNGYRCDYKSDQDAYQIFLVPMESDSAAQAVLKKYQNFLVSQDYTVLPQANETQLIAEKEHSILAFVSLSYFGGILNINRLQEGQRLVKTMKNNLLNR